VLFITLQVRRLFVEGALKSSIPTTKKLVKYVKTKSTEILSLAAETTFEPHRSMLLIMHLNVERSAKGS
jgi:hypothetical protein